MSQGVVVQNEQYKGSASADPGDLCTRFCNMLGMNNYTVAAAIKLAAKMKSNGALAGRSPLSAAAACIYMAGHLMGEPKSAKDIQAVAKVSDSTIRQSYKLLYQVKDDLLDADVLQHNADPAKLPKPA